MPKTLTQLQRQIARLREQAEAMHQQEVDEVIARIREAIDHYGLSAADLGFAPRRVRARRVAPRVSRKKAASIKYRDDAGNTWTGHGRRPRWYLEALAAGKTAKDLAA